MNGHVQSRDDRARLIGLHRAGLQELQQGWTIEPLKDEAEAPIEGHLVEYLWGRLTRAVARQGPGEAGDRDTHDACIAQDPGLTH